MKRECAFLLSLLLASGSLSFAQKAKVYTTTEQTVWKKTAVRVNSSSAKEADIIVSDCKEQLIDGFGGAFSEIGWDALSALSDKQRNGILEDLFGEKGLNLNWGRIPLGANDFARDWYSFNETPGDFEMRNFSIERDTKTMIPYVKAALECNPDLILWASPWSPPVWMKATKHYATSAGDHNDFTKENEVEGDHFIQKPEYLSAYALYLAKAMEAYKDCGINISMLQFQNEPYTINQWPNCRWLPKSMANFIGNYLGPTFEERELDVDLWFGTFNCNKMEDLNCVMQDPAASRYLHGIGLQWEGKDIVAEAHKEYPSMKLMMTENECGNGSIDWAAAEHTFDLMMAYLGGGVNSYMYFNLVLGNEGYSSWGWKQNSLIRINEKTKEAIYTPEFYLMKHVSHFVSPGAYRLEVGKGENVLAFQNSNGQIVIVCVNKETQEKSVEIECGKGRICLQMAPKSFNTIIL